MKISFIIILITVFSNAFSQEKQYDPYGQISLNKNQKNIKDSFCLKQKKTYVNFSDETIFTIQNGIWIPLGNLKNIYEPSFSLSLKFGYKHKNNGRVDVGIVINTADSKRFKFYSHDTTFITKSDLNLILAIWYSSKIQLSNKLFLDRYLGFGGSIITTNTKKNKKEKNSGSYFTYSDNKNNDNDDNSYYSIETFYLNLGLRLEHIVFNNKIIGLYTEYNFTPNSFFQKTSTDFGNSSLTCGVLLRI